MFNLRNIKRIDDEFLRVEHNNFPLFYIQKQTFDEFDKGNDIKLYLPTSGEGCWVVKTPCVNGTSGVSAKIKYGFKIFYIDLKE